MSVFPGSPQPVGPQRAFVIAAWVFVAAVLGLALRVVADVLLLVFAGILVSLFLRSLSASLSQLTGLSDGWSLAIVLALLTTVIGLTGWLLGAEIISQLDQLLPRLQKAWSEVRGQLRHYEWGRTLLANMSFKALARDKDWLAQVTGGIFSTTLGAIAGFLVIFFVGLYVALTPRTYMNGVLQVLPPSVRERVAQVLEAIGVTLRWWLLGTFVKMVLVGTATTVGLLLLDMPLALALGMIAFLMEFVPYLGPILAAIPALLVATAVGSTEVGYVLLLYLGVQAAENYIVSPLIDQRSVNVPPVLAFTVQLLMGVSSLGVLGVFLAIPLTAAGMVLVKMLYIEDKLGECTDASPDSLSAVCVPPNLPGEPGNPEGKKRESGI